MNGITDAILRFFTGGDDIAGFLGAFAMIGIGTTALIQAVKELVPIRRWFQRVRLQDWIAKCARSGSASATQGEQQLYALAVDGDECALLNLPSEEMATHMTAAMRAAVENPSHHRELFLIGAHRAPRKDVETLLETPTQDGAPDDRKLVEIAEARSRVWYHMQRAVTGFELATGYRWKLYLQATSFLVSAGLATVAVTLYGSGSITVRAGQVVSSAVLAGFLAPVARDLTVVLKRLREGKVS